MEKYFRFRSMDALLGKYQELEKQTIYFANPEELNDPMEGFRDIVWNGDKIAWTNLFKHYTLCLHRVFSMFRVIGGSEELNVRNIPILYSQDELLTPQEKDLFNSIWQKFFNVSKMEEITEAIVDTRRKIRYREIIYYLQIIHFILLETIRKLHITRGLMSESEMPQLSEELIATSVEQILKIIELTEGIENDQQLDIFWEIQTIFDDNRRLIQLIQQYNSCKISNEILTKNNELVIFDFPKVYVEKLKNLPFYKWWTACFTKSYDNLSVWGHYADGHRGACLIFGDNLNWKSVKYWITSFHEVSYENKLTEIDFFRSIGAGTVAEIMKTWYTNEDGKRSECASHIGDESEGVAWRKDYWDNLFRIITTKNRDWEYEQEYRVILYDIVRGVVEKADRTLTYDFNSLKGIIFGMRTSIEDKLKIINIIKSKCDENNRIDFKFFQAYYSPENGEIRKYEILLR